MKVEARHPRGWLRHYVDHVWRCSGFRDEDPELRGWILPEPGFNIVFNLGATHRLFAGPQPDEHARSWVAGERSRPVAISVAGPTAYVGVRLHPGAGNAFLGVTASELTDRTLDLDLVWGPLAERTRDRLHDADDIDTIAHILFRTLESRLLTNGAPPAVLGDSISALRAAAPGTSIRDVAADLGVSHSTMLRQFDHWVGVRPKMMQRLFRFERVLLTEALDQCPPWTDIADLAGYYDQAHLAHDFRQFAQMSPARYRAARCPLPAGVMLDVEGVPSSMRRFRRGAVLEPNV